MFTSLVLNPTGRHYSALQSHLLSTYKDTYFDQDAIYLERNSRDFQQRARAIDVNTEAVCDLLYTNSVAGGHCDAVVQNVYYPKYITSHHYQRCRDTGGFGGLFSLTFVSQQAAQIFYEALECFKGPSLGTNFTLASPYTILAHYMELDWAEQWGVNRNLIRISVGMEDKEVLLRRFHSALADAKRAVKSVKN